MATQEMTVTRRSRTGSPHVPAPASCSSTLAVDLGDRPDARRRCGREPARTAATRTPTSRRSATAGGWWSRCMAVGFVLNRARRRRSPRWRWPGTRGAGWATVGRRGMMFLAPRCRPTGVAGWATALLLRHRTGASTPPAARRSSTGWADDLRLFAWRCRARCWSRSARRAGGRLVAVPGDSRAGCRSCRWPICRRSSCRTPAWAACSPGAARRSRRRRRLVRLASRLRGIHERQGRLRPAVPGGNTEGGAGGGPGAACGGHRAGRPGAATGLTGPGPRVAGSGQVDRAQHPVDARARSACCPC